MAQRSHVPKFGNWESEENVPYTAYFNKARKDRSEGGKITNPNDPEDNPDAFADDVPPAHPPSRITDDLEVSSAAAATTLNPKHEQRASREDGDVRRLTDSPGRHENAGRRPSTDSSHQRHGERGINQSDHQRRGNRTSLGSDRSIEHSPLHPHYQAKATSKGGVSSPSWERKGSSEGSSHGLAPSTPVRSRLKSAGRGDESPERGAAVPKFGDWDENNPASADGFTHIFNKVREEKQTESAKIPVMPTESPYQYSHDNTSEESTICCCFSRSKN